METGRRFSRPHTPPTGRNHLHSQRTRRINHPRQSRRRRNPAPHRFPDRAPRRIRCEKSARRTARGRSEDERKHPETERRSQRAAGCPHESQHLHRICQRHHPQPRCRTRCGCEKTQRTHRRVQQTGQSRPIQRTTKNRGSKTVRDCGSAPSGQSDEGQHPARLSFLHPIRIVSRRPRRRANPRIKDVRHSRSGQLTPDLCRKIHLIVRRPDART